MSIEIWFAFALASAVLVAIPGPTVILVISYSLAHGKAAARASVAGVGLGDFTAMTASLLGLGALLSASAFAFDILRWAGAAYLVWLGIKLWRAPVAAPEDGVDLAPPRASRIFAHAWLVTALNPKSIVFFVAFLPQFLDPSRPLALQMAVMEATFLALAILNAALYAWVAGRARERIRRPSVRLIVNRIGGSMMIAAGMLALAWRRAAA